MKAWIIVGVTMIAGAMPAHAKGLHVDAHAGADIVSSDGESKTGAVYGFGFGYDLEGARSLFGVEFQADATSTRKCERNLIVTGDRTCIKGDSDGALVARAGVITQGGARVYGLAGLAVARFRATYNLGAVSARSKEDLEGLRVGAGVELPLSSKVGAKLEYRYTNFEQGVSRHQAVAGISFHF